MVSIKVMDPVSVPVSVLAELTDLRSKVEALLRENERLRADNERLRRELDESQRQAKRQAAPFSKGLPKPHPRNPDAKPVPPTDVTAIGRRPNRST